MSRTRTTFALLTATSFFLIASSRVAAAQCRSDRDCPSNRVCIDTSCLFRLDGDASLTATSRPIRPFRPATVPQPQPTFRLPATTPRTTVTTRARDPGWAFEAGVTGIVSSALVLGFGLAAEVTLAPGEFVPSMPLGGVAMLFLGAGVPLVAAGGASARERSGLPDNTFLRIAGWGLYGLSVTIGIITTIVSLSTEISRGIITTTTLLGTGSLVIFTVDAFKARNDALALTPSSAHPYAAAKSGPRLTLAPRTEGGRVNGVTLGLGGTF